MTSVMTFQLGEVLATSSSAVSEDVPSGRAVLDLDSMQLPASLFRSPERLETPIDYTMAVSVPRRHDYRAEPETPSVWEALRQEALRQRS